jgi:hypothetical protein
VARYGYLRGTRCRRACKIHFPRRDDGCSDGVWAPWGFVPHDAACCAWPPVALMVALGNRSSTTGILRPLGSHSACGMAFGSLGAKVAYGATQGLEGGFIPLPSPCPSTTNSEAASRVPVPTRIFRAPFLILPAGASWFGLGMYSVCHLRHVFVASPVSVALHRALRAGPLGPVTLGCREGRRGLSWYSPIWRWCAAAASCSVVPAFHALRRTFGGACESVALSPWPAPGQGHPIPRAGVFPR